MEWKNVKAARIVNYGFVGGCGIRPGTKNGIVYNIQGNKELTIELKNGKKFVIGTQKEAELTRVIRKMPFANCGCKYSGHLSILIISEDWNVSTS